MNDILGSGQTNNITQTSGVRRGRGMVSPWRTDVGLPTRHCNWIRLATHFFGEYARMLLSLHRWLLAIAWPSGRAGSDCCHFGARNILSPCQLGQTSQLPGSFGAMLLLACPSRCPWANDTIQRRRCVVVARRLFLRQAVLNLLLICCFGGGPPPPAREIFCHETADDRRFRLTPSRPVYES